MLLHQREEYTTFSDNIHYVNELSWWYRNVNWCRILTMAYNKTTLRDRHGWSDNDTHWMIHNNVFKVIIKCLILSHVLCLHMPACQTLFYNCCLSIRCIFFNGHYTHIIILIINYFHHLHINQQFFTHKPYTGIHFFFIIFVFYLLFFAATSTKSIEYQPKLHAKTEVGRKRN